MVRWQGRAEHFRDSCVILYEMIKTGPTRDVRLAALIALLILSTGIACVGVSMLLIINGILQEVGL